jgi:hypothetical protein
MVKCGVLFEVRTEFLNIFRLAFASKVSKFFKLQLLFLHCNIIRFIKACHKFVIFVCCIRNRLCQLLQIMQCCHYCVFRQLLFLLHCQETGNVRKSFLLLRVIEFMFQVTSVADGTTQAVI